MNVITEQQRQLLQQSIEEYDESATDGLIIEQKPPTLTKTDISINTKEISEYSGTEKNYYNRLPGKSGSLRRTKRIDTPTNSNDCLHSARQDLLKQPNKNTKKHTQITLSEIKSHREIRRSDLPTPTKRKIETSRTKRPDSGAINKCTRRRIPQSRCLARQGKVYLLYAGLAIRHC